MKLLFLIAYGSCRRFIMFLNNGDCIFSIHTSYGYIIVYVGLAYGMDVVIFYERQYIFIFGYSVVSVNVLAIRC